MTMGMFFWVKKVVPALIVAADGSGDFTTIQAVIDALPATGGQVLVKAGTYVITVQINIDKSNVTLTGSGKATKIQTTGNIEAIHTATQDRVIISDLYVYGSGSGNASNRGINFVTNCSNCSVRGCWVENCGSHGMVVTGDNMSAVGNQVYSNYGYGILAGATTLIEGNYIYSNVQHGVVMAGNKGVCSNNVIYDNDVNNTASYDGIFVRDRDINIISGNVCLDNDRYEINIDTLAADFPERTIVVYNTVNGTDHVGAINDNGINTQIGHNITE